MNANKQSRILYIVQKEKTLGNQIENLQKYLETPTADHINAKLRLETISILHKECIKYNDELISLQSDHPQLELFYDVESRYYDIATTVNKLQKGDSNLNTSNLTITERQDTPKLPSIKLPTFDGSHDSWLAYKNKFIALVHSRSDISNLIKYTQLEDSLAGSALDKISEFPPSDENYPKAWQTLIESYDHKRLLVVEHLDALLDLPLVPKATISDLSKLIDKSRQQLSMLEQLEARPSEEIVVRILERRLPAATRSRWEEKLDLNNLPSLEDFYKFLQNTIFKLRSLQRANLIGPNNSRKRTAESLDTFQAKNAKSNARSFVTTSNTSCIKCNEPHWLFKCPKFEKLKISERWDFVKANKLCRNCLNIHPFPCKNDKRCKKCEREHHTLLHSDKKSKDQAQTSIESLQNLKNTKPSGSTNPQA